MSGRAAFASLVVVVAAAAWLATGVHVLQQDERGVVVRMGRAARVVEPGMHVLLPWPIERLERVHARVLSMPVGFRLEDRVKGIGPQAQEVQWLTGDTNIAEMQAMALYTIEDPVAYLFGVADRDEERRFVVRKAAEAVLTDLVARMPIDELLAGGKARLQHEAIVGTQALLDEIGLGVRVSGLNVVDVTVPANVIRAFENVQNARAERERRISEAQSYRNTTLPRARADADRVASEAQSYLAETTSRAKGEAESFRKIAAAVHASPDPSLAKRRLWLESLSRILAEGRKIVFEPLPDGARTRVVLTE